MKRRAIEFDSLLSILAANLVCAKLKFDRISSSAAAFASTSSSLVQQLSLAKKFDIDGQKTIIHGKQVFSLLLSSTFLL